MSEVTKVQPVNLNEMQPTTPATLVQMAVSQGADLERIEKLMELQTKWEEGQARKAFTIAMTEFRSNCPAIDKNAKGHNSKYATLAHTLELIKEPLSQNGLSHNWQTKQSENGIITVTCFVTHNLGYKESTQLSALGDTSGSKNQIQGIGSTISYLQRYTLFSILGLASAGQDDDGKESSSNNQSADAVEAEWIKRVASWRELIPSIHAIKEGIATGNLEGAIESWRELSEEEHRELWFPAPSKGGILTTQERTVIKSDEWAEVGRGL
jgi:hypothetical protein